MVTWSEAPQAPTSKLPKIATHFAWTLLTAGPRSTLVDRVCARRLDDGVERRVSDGHHAGVRRAEAMAITFGVMGLPA